MNVLPGRSFAVKLTVLITVVSGLAAALVCTALVLIQVRRTLDAAVDTVSSHARVIAANSTAALDFEDEEAARETLGALAAVREFAAAEIRKPDGSVLASYERDDGERVPAFFGGSRPRIDGRWLTLAHPIVRDGEPVGTLTLLYDFGPARRRLLFDVGLAVGITAGAMVLAFLAARRLQRSLLRPVRELSRAAAAIASAEDYSIRARKYSNDELGVLTGVFNGMIGRIEEAEALRRDHQAMLEREVAQRSAEILEAQSRLRQSERMASLGTLSAGLGHDIGNLLMPLRLHLSAIRDRMTREGGHGAGGAAEDFAAIARATEYLQNLSSGLRLMARDPDQTSRRREATRLGAWWATTEPLLRAAIGSRVALGHDLPEDLPPVRFSGHLLTQVVFNLVQNAAQAMEPEGGPPTPDARIRVWGGVVAGGDGGRFVRLGVTDNGPGMTEEVKRRCLEPYFTTKTRRISSGLGLSLVKGIVESVGGTLEIESEPGKGTTFTVSLPAGASSPAPRVPAVVTIKEPRKRAVVSHVLASLNCDVRAGPAGVRPTDPPPEGGLWVTDSFNAVPGAWRGRVVVFGEAPAALAGVGGRITAIDPSTPLPALRKIFQQFLPGADDVHASHPDTAGEQAEDFLRR